MFFKLKERSDASWGSYLGFCLSTVDSEGLHNVGVYHNILRLTFMKKSWYFIVPPFIKPKRKWVDTSNMPWNSDKTGPQGYWESIRKQYGIDVTEESVNLMYGIQPGCWISNDRKNSDHYIVLRYPWRLEHVRHEVFDLNGKVLCNGEHFSRWKSFKWEAFRDGNPRAENLSVQERQHLFKRMPWFTLPRDPKLECPIWSKDYDNWAEVDVDPAGIFLLCEYKDKDGTTTLAWVHVEEREWNRGKWKWLRFILKRFPWGRIVRRSIQIEFLDEVGPKKGSWKGGVIGTGFEMLPNETARDCWKRFCGEWRA